DNTTWSFAFSHSANPSRNVIVARSYCCAEGDGRIARINSSGPNVINTRVRAADGIRITVYVICIRSAVDLERARREHRRVVGRGPSGTWRNFLASHIRHRLCFHLLPRHRGPLMLGMIAAALVAPLMPGIRQAPDRTLRELATLVAAVLLSTVVATTDVERPGAVAAAQLEDVQRVHPSRMAKNWTSTSETTTVPAYWRVHPPLVHRGLRWHWALTLSIRPAPTYPNASHRATSRPAARVVPGSPVIPVEMVPSEAGGDSRRWLAWR